MIEEATGQILELGAVFALLILGIIFMYRFFTKQIDMLQSKIDEKDNLIQEQNKELSNLVSKDIEATKQIDLTLNLLLNMIQHGR